MVFIAAMENLGCAVLAATAITFLWWAADRALKVSRHVVYLDFFFGAVSAAFWAGIYGIVSLIRSHL